ncbi:hypothetical protein B9Z55_018657 [Caenorhabditis nigoni]|uniref:C2H2-type domain-containing protein n=1 Tax=Caenorhabditis nigoni TaxID=1611254 RepID=A0A2G5TF85_9PELO|nr:hypothetical protein B9Z55_018657 [Caenorhabditis nigoni]
MAVEHQCPQCHAKFHQPSMLRRHMETHMITGDWMCGLCNALSTRLTALKLHWKQSCPEMKEVFCDEERKAMSYDEIQEAAFRLTLDQYSYETEINYQEPGPSDRPLFDQKSTPSVCIYCNLHLPRGTLNMHYGVHTNQNRPGQFSQSLPVAYVCDLCGCGFRFKKSLYHHWRHSCAELMAHCPALGMTIDNRQLRKMVEDLVKHAEVVAPYEIIKHNDEIRKAYDDEADDDEDEETKLSFTSRIIPPANRDRHLWNVGNHQSLHSCSQCNRRFHSIGRLDRHINIFHDAKKAIIHCELCQVRCSSNRTLMMHLRENCRATKIEVPDDGKRKKMTREEMRVVITNAKQRWNELFAKKKADNIKFISEFLNDLDKKKPRFIEEVVHHTPILDVPVPHASFVVDSVNHSHICVVCKIKFNSARFLYQHEQLVHSTQPNHFGVDEVPRNQLTITASSLLPYFKLPEALFYDSNGNKYRMGKFVEKGQDFAKHLKTRVITAGTKVEKVEENDFFVVRLVGNSGHHILLNHVELLDLCGADRKLKQLFSDNPKEYDDIPILVKEV